MKNILPLIYGLLTHSLIWCQQTPLTQFFQQNWISVNPAAIDRTFLIFEENNPFVFHASFREQWVGVKGAPRQYFAGFEHKPVGKAHFKWGMQFLGEQTGNITSNGVFFNYGYSIQLKNYSRRKIYFGINGGFVSYGIETDKLNIPDRANGDLNQLNNSTLGADFSFGVFYTHGNGFYAGFSVPQVLTFDLGEVANDDHISYDKNLSYHFVLGALLDVVKGIHKGIPKFGLEPSIWVRHQPDVTFLTQGNPLPLSVDVNLRSYFMDNKFWLGAGYSTNRYLSMEVGLNQPISGILGSPQDRIRAGIGYSFPFMNENVQLGNSLEINLAFSWN